LSANALLRPALRAALVPTLGLALALPMGGVAAARVVGSDIASWQHPRGASISWNAVRDSGHHFVFVKATEGQGYHNPYFHRDWRGSRHAGLIRGAYHFARPNLRHHSAQRQAHKFVRVAGHARARAVLPPTLDLEVTGGLGPKRLKAWTHRWLRTVTHLTHRRPMIYSYPYFWAHAMNHSKGFRHYRLWGASYVGRPTTFGHAWGHWTFWQYTPHAHVHGIRGRTDMNVFHGGVRHLRRIAHLRHRDPESRDAGRRSATRATAHPAVRSGSAGTAPVQPASAKAIPSRMSCSLAVTSSNPHSRMTVSSTSAPAAMTSTRPGCITGSAARAARSIASSPAVTSPTFVAEIRAWWMASGS
jgi:lysozyme